MAKQDDRIKNYPFGKTDGKYQIPKGKAKVRTLKTEELSLLYYCTPQDKNEEVYLKYWFFMYFCSGMNMIDVVKLKYKDIKGNNIVFIRQKTRDTAQTLPIVTIYMIDEVKQIINEIGNEDKSPENYIFPILNSGMTEKEIHRANKQHVSLTNKYVRRAAERIGIEGDIATYWARHTFGAQAVLHNVPTEYISQQFAHKSIKTTRAYLEAAFEDDHRQKFTESLIPKSDK